MEYSAFVSKAIKEDSRNTFSVCTEELNLIPNEAKDFYQNYNPLDVEIGMNGSSVKFYPVSELEELQSDYQYLGVDFVFATCDGDPIFLHEKKVYMCPHDVDNPKWEKMADGFRDFFSLF